MSHHSDSDLDIRSGGGSSSSSELTRTETTTASKSSSGASFSMAGKTTTTNAALDRAKAAPPVQAQASTPTVTAPTPKPPTVRRGATAQEMSAKQRDISVAEFFQKNRHMLGFDNKRKALLTTVKEAVDNSLDACEEAGILPDIAVKIQVAQNGDGTWPSSPAQAERFIVSIEDNGPGIVKKNIGKVFAKLLYGSKFHRLRMSRGQQGIGISAAGMYGQLTTGKPTKVITKILNEPKAHCIEVSIDTKKNEPVEHETKQIEWDREHGTSVAIELVGEYRKGKQSVDEYLELTSVANPHAKFTYIAPGEDVPRVFPRGVDTLPDQPREIKPHPHGIELGMLQNMLKSTVSHWLSGFLSTDFCRVSSRNATQICETAGLNPRMRPRDVSGPDSEKLFKALQGAKLMSPPTDCISPMGEKAIIAGMVKQIKADFWTASTRPPKVYRGNPFVIECGLAYGKGDGQAFKDPAQLALEEREKARNGKVEAKAVGEKETDDVPLAEVIRFANRVPLQYQATACATYKAVLKTAWKNYGLSQSKGALPQGHLVLFIHIASVWVPFTNQAKEAVAEYDEIMDEIKRALQECGRKLGIELNKRKYAKDELKRRSAFQGYIGEVAKACKSIKGGKLDAEKLAKQLQAIAQEVTGGDEVDQILKKQNPQQEALEHTVVLTPEGLKGDVEIKTSAVGGLILPQGAPADVAVTPPGELIPGATVTIAPLAPDNTKPRTGRNFVSEKEIQATLFDQSSAKVPKAKKK